MRVTKISWVITTPRTPCTLKKPRKHSELPTPFRETPSWVQIIQGYTGIGNATSIAREILSVMPVDTAVFRKADLHSKHQTLNNQRDRISGLVRDSFFNYFPETKAVFQAADPAQKVLFRLSALLHATRTPEVLDGILQGLSLPPNDDWRMVLQAHIKTIAEWVSLDLNPTPGRPPEINPPPLSDTAKRLLWNTGPNRWQPFLLGFGIGSTVFSGILFYLLEVTAKVEIFGAVFLFGLLAGGLGWMFGRFQLGGQKQFAALHFLFLEMVYLNRDHAELVHNETCLKKAPVPPKDSSQVKADSVALGKKVMAMQARASSGELIPKKEIKDLRRECRIIHGQIVSLIESSNRQLEAFAKFFPR